MEWIAIPIVIVLGMLGGQTWKWTRRYVLPASVILIDINNSKNKKKYWLLLLMLVLTMGYGVDSKLGKLLGGKDWLVRLVYGLLVGIVVALAGFVWSVIVMPIAWLVRIPYSFKVGKFDFLWEDFVRYSALGLCIWRALC